MRVMNEVNYKPDALARSFSSRRSEAIALIMPPTLDSLNDPYFMNLLRAVLEAVRDYGYKMLLEIADERFVEQRLWDDLFARKCIDGLVIATPQLDQDYLVKLASLEQPVLLLNGARPDLPQLDYVGYDDHRCGFDAAYYLIGLGHRRIAHLTGPENHGSAQARLAGYRQALERARIPFRPEDVLPGDYRHDSGEEAMKTLLERPIAERPTALFCANDTMAIAAMQIAQAKGVSVPDDFSLVGVDDTGAAAKAAPPLTTFRQDTYALAKRAATLFLKKLEERTREQIFDSLPMTLVERATCAPWEGRRGEN
jgi:LacI family repressor for deo operon, udp, cdd, tsx, nupC, and nupG